jgi:minor histocompatibility antigen H13
MAMAHFAGLLISQVNATLEQADALVNDTAPAKPKSTPEGILTAYVSLIVMALIPILVGSFKSVEQHISQKKKCRVSFLS